MNLVIKILLISIKISFPGFSGEENLSVYLQFSRDSKYLCHSLAEVTFPRTFLIPVRSSNSTPSPQSLTSHRSQQTSGWRVGVHCSILNQQGEKIPGLTSIPASFPKQQVSFPVALINSSLESLVRLYCYVCDHVNKLMV